MGDSKTVCIKGLIYTIKMISESVFNIKKMLNQLIIKKNNFAGFDSSLKFKSLSFNKLIISKLLSFSGYIIKGWKRLDNEQITSIEINIQ